MLPSHSSCHLSILPSLPSPIFDSDLTSSPLVLQACAAAPTDLAPWLNRSASLLKLGEAAGALFAAVEALHISASSALPPTHPMRVKALYRFAAASIAMLMPPDKTSGVQADSNTRVVELEENTIESPVAQTVEGDEHLPMAHPCKNGLETPVACPDGETTGDGSPLERTLLASALATACVESEASHAQLQQVYDLFRARGTEDDFTRVANKLARGVKLQEVLGEQSGRGDAAGVAKKGGGRAWRGGLTRVW